MSTSIGTRSGEFEPRGTARRPATNSTVDLQNLEAEFEGLLAEAAARVRVLELGRDMLGARAPIETVRLLGTTQRIASEDVRPLASVAERIEALRAAAKAKHSSRAVEIPARSVTVSVLLDLAIRVTYRGRTVVDEDLSPTYLGLQLWSHPAHPEVGVEASRASGADRDRAIERVRARALRSLETTLSKQALLARLDAEERFPFILSLARGSKRAADVRDLEWWIEKVYEVPEAHRSAVAARLLDTLP